MTLYGRLVEPLEVGKISNNNIIHSFIRDVVVLSSNENMHPSAVLVGYTHANNVPTMQLCNTTFNTI